MNTKEMLEEILGKIFQLYNFNLSSATITERENGGFIVTIKENEESGFLIGYHGKTIEAFQYLINILLFYQTQNWHEVVVEIGEYRKKKEQFLISLADKAVEKVLFMHQSVSLAPMTSSERKIVHLHLQDNPQIFTQSEGVGTDRHIVVYPKTESEIKE